MYARRVPWLVILAAACSGAVAGHALTYLTLVPQAGLRAALLASTGHGYWTAAVFWAVLLGLGSAVVVAVRHFRTGLRAETESALWLTPQGLALRLAALQGGIFVVQEVAERLYAGAPLAGLVREPVLAVGVPAQVLVALALALILFLLGRAALAAGRAVARASHPRSASRPRIDFARTSFGSLPIVGIASIRAPPSP